jgi:lipopolysaccharide export system permease protein
LLVQNNELVVFRASGLSLYRLLSIVLRTVFFLLIAVSYCGEWIAPDLNKKSVELKQRALYQASDLVHHYWWKNKDTFYFIDHAENETTVVGLGSIDLPIHSDAAQISYAPSATKIGDDWLIRNETATEFKENNSFVFDRHNKIVPAKLNINASQVARHEVNQESVFNLKKVIEERKQEGQPIGPFQIAYWGRELQPLATLVLVLLGVPIVFTEIRRSTTGSRLLLGMAIGFGFYLLNQLLAPIGMLLIWPPAWIVTLPIVVFLIVGLILMQKVSR